MECYVPYRSDDFHPRNYCQSYRDIRGTKKHLLGAPIGMHVSYRMDGNKFLISGSFEGVLSSSFSSSPFVYYKFDADSFAPRSPFLRGIRYRAIKCSSPYPTLSRGWKMQSKRERKVDRLKGRSCRMRRRRKRERDKKVACKQSEKESCRS